MAGLVITRKPGEQFTIGDDITVTILEIGGGSARVRIEAPADVAIHRTELNDRDRGKRP
jgi:carbon storage regulator